MEFVPSPLELEEEVTFMMAEGCVSLQKQSPTSIIEACNGMRQDSRGGEKTEAVNEVLQDRGFGVEPRPKR